MKEVAGLTRGVRGCVLSEPHGLRQISVGELDQTTCLRLMQGRVVRSCSAYHRNLPLVETLQLADLGRANGQS